MSASAISPEEKRTLARRVGKDLNKHCGRKSFYQSVGRLRRAIGDPIIARKTDAGWEIPVGEPVTT